MHADRLVALLRALGLAVDIARGAGADVFHATRRSPPLAVLVGPLRRGFALPADRLVVVAEEEIFGARALREARPSKAPAFGDLGEIAEGDAVVHDEHGIGRYRGLKQLVVRGVPQDFMHLEYDGGSVYIPVYRIGLVHRYTGGEAADIKLDKLGAKTWQDKRKRVSAEARKIAEELMQLYAQRAALAGHAFPAPDAVFSAFEETFPFDETPDQAKAIETVLADMQAGVPMDRLICGDVGYGKTEVALRASLLAVLGGKQVAVLAPTTVLAEQHFVTFSERLGDFPARVAVLSRFRSKAEQQQTVASLADGKLDIVVGTHRLLSRDVRFKDLGLLVIDEEQRFGVTPQGAAEGAAHAGRRADPDGDADPAHAADGDGGAARDLDHRDAARRPPGDPHLRLPLGQGPAGRGDPARACARRAALLRPQPDRGPRGAGEAHPGDRARGDPGRRSATARCPRGSSRR